MIELIMDRIKNKKMYSKIESVARSNMSRKLRYYLIEDNRLIEVTKYIKEKLGQKSDWEPINVKGCGMNMVEYTLYEFQKAVDPKRAEFYGNSCEII